MTRLVLVGIACMALAVVPQGQGAQKAGPWKSLFDGKSLGAWRTYRSETPPEKWDIKDGIMSKDGNASDLVSKDEFGDFELELDWKIGEAGNSGIFYRGTEDDEAHLLDGARVSAARQHQGARQQDAATTAPRSVYDLYARPTGT